MLPPLSVESGDGEPSTAGAVPPPVPITVHHAETGRSYRLSANGTDSSVGTLSAALEPATGIPYARQILLLNGNKLEAERSLAEYGLPSPDLPIFLYNQRSLSRMAPPPERQAVPPFELELPTELKADQMPRGQLNVPPLVRALLDYECHFCLHLIQARTVAEVGGARLAAASQCVHELVIQGAAQQSAFANLNVFADQLDQRYTAFETHCSSILPKQAALVASFEEVSDPQPASMQSAPAFHCRMHRVPAYHCSMHRNVSLLLSYVPDNAQHSHRSACMRLFRRMSAR